MRRDRRKGDPTQSAHIRDHVLAEGNRHLNSLHGWRALVAFPRVSRRSRGTLLRAVVALLLRRKP